MNLLESFSLTTKIEPAEAFIYEKFFPLDFNDYIVLETQNQDSNFHYVFWYRVIDLISPFLKEKNIKIIHFIDNQKYNFDHVYIDKEVSTGQKAYLLRKAKLFCGSSKLYSLICSEYNINQVFLKVDNILDNTLVSPDKTINCNNKSKNFFNPNGLTINNIRPEVVAKKILKELLNIDVLFDNTLSIGRLYAPLTIELVPDCFFEMPKENHQQQEIVVRMDKFFSEENLSQQLNYTPCSIVTNKALSDSILEKKSFIKKIFFRVDKNSDPSFLDKLETLKINYDIISCLSQEEIQEEKIKYLNYKKVNKINVADDSFLQGLDISKVYFKTNKIMIHNQRTHASSWHIKNSQPSGDVRAGNFSIPPILDNQFREEMDYFYILTKEQL
jgi:hypothetical protein